MAVIELNHGQPRVTSLLSDSAYLDSTTMNSPLFPFAGSIATELHLFSWSSSELRIFGFHYYDFSVISIRRLNCYRTAPI